MDRKSKTASVRLSGIFDLFNESKTESDCQKDPHEVEKKLMESTEKKKGLFSFRKKASSDSKVYEKQKNKFFFRQTSKPESSTSVSQAVPPGGCHIQNRDTGVDDTVVLRRHVKSLALDSSTVHKRSNFTQSLILNLTGQGEAVSAEQYCCSEDLSPTEKKRFSLGSKKSKFFRLPSKNKEKFVETVTPSVSNMCDQSTSTVVNSYPVIGTANAAKSECTVPRLSTRGEKLFTVMPPKTSLEMKNNVRSEESEHINNDFNAENSREYALFNDALRLKGSQNDDRSVNGICESEIYPCERVLDSMTMKCQQDKDTNVESDGQAEVSVLHRVLGNIICTLSKSMKQSSLTLKNFVVSFVCYIICFMFKFCNCLMSSLFFCINSIITGLKKAKKAVMSVVCFMPVPKRRQNNQVGIRFEQDIEFDKRSEVGIGTDIMPYSLNANMREPNEIRGESFNEEENTNESPLFKPKHTLQVSKQKWWKILRQSSQEEKLRVKKHEPVHGIDNAGASQDLSIYSSFKSDKDLADEDLTDCSTVKRNWSESIENTNIYENKRLGTNEVNEINKDTEIRKAGYAIKYYFWSLLSFSLYTILFLPLRVIKVLRYVHGKLILLKSENTVESENNMAGQIDNTKLPNVEETMFFSQKKRKSWGSKIRSSTFKFLSISKKHKFESEDDTFNENKREGNSFEENADMTNTAKTPQHLIREPRVSVWKLISWGERICDIVFSCIEWTADMMERLFDIVFYCVKLLILYIMRFICFVIMLPLNIILLLIHCFCSVVLLILRFIISVAKLLYFMIALILSLPLRVVVLLRHLLCLLVKLFWRCYAFAVRKLNLKGDTRAERVIDDSSNIISHDASQSFIMASEMHENNSEKVAQKKLGILSLLKRWKKSMDKNSDSEKRISSHDENNLPIRSESSASEMQSEEKLKSHYLGANLSIKKTFTSTIRLLLKLLSIILLLPLAIFTMLSSTFLFFGCLCNKVSLTFRNFLTLIWKSPEASSVDTSISESNKKSTKLMNIKIFHKVKKSEEKLEKEILCVEVTESEKLRYRSDSAGENLSRNTRTSESEESEESNNKSRFPLDHRPYMAHFRPYLNIFFHLQSIYVQAFWHRVNSAVSHLCKIILMGFLRLTPKMVVKWSMILACQYTPGVRNRTIIVQFLKESPAQVTKKLAETYLRRVSISVMLVHVQMSLKDSPTKKVLKLVSETWRSVAKLLRKVFLGVSDFFKDIARALKTKRKMNKQTTTEKIIVRVKRGISLDGKEHEE